MRWFYDKLFWTWDQADEWIPERPEEELLRSVAAVKLCLPISGIAENSLQSILVSIRRITSIWSCEFQVQSALQETFAIEWVLGELNNKWVNVEKQAEIIPLLRESIRAEIAFNSAEDCLRSLKKVFDNAKGNFEKAKQLQEVMIADQNNFNDSLDKLWLWSGIDFLWSVWVVIWDGSRVIDEIERKILAAESIKTEIQTWANERRDELVALRESTGLELKWINLLRSSEEYVSF